jgi:asparagine synthase (glutamine-hydrolysing)
MLCRGPDAEGTWSDLDGHLYLGFRRLAVIDPTPAGHQPMISGDGRSVLVFTVKSTTISNSELL